MTLDYIRHRLQRTVEKSIDLSFPHEFEIVCHHSISDFSHIVHRNTMGLSINSFGNG